MPGGHEAARRFYVEMSFLAEVRLNSG